MTTTLPKSILTKDQTKTYGPRFYRENGRKMKMIVHIQYDDQCGNGHNTFSITCDIYEQAKNGQWVDKGGGADHEEISKHFSELQPVIKWHLTSSDGPAFYLYNTLYHAGNRDRWGLLKGERTRPWETIGEGKERDLDAARSSAVWPDATDEDLCLPKEELTAKLEARLPALMEEFKTAMESLGFVY